MEQGSEREAGQGGARPLLHHGNKGLDLSISSLLTIAVLKFQLWNLFCATAWNRNVGAVPKFAQW